MIRKLRQDHFGWRTVLRVGQLRLAWSSPDLIVATPLCQSAGRYPPPHTPWHQKDARRCSTIGAFTKTTELWQVCRLTERRRPATGDDRGSCHRLMDQRRDAGSRLRCRGAPCGRLLIDNPVLPAAFATHWQRDEPAAWRSCSRRSRVRRPLLVVSPPVRRRGFGRQLVQVDLGFDTRRGGGLVAVAREQRRRPCALSRARFPRRIAIHPLGVKSVYPGPRCCDHGRSDRLSGAGNYIMIWPPLADSVEPVINPASSEAKNTTQRAISSG